MKEARKIANFLSDYRTVGISVFAVPYCPYIVIGKFAF